MIRVSSIAAALAVAAASLAPGSARAQDAALAERLAAADPEVGESVFRQCRSCHTVDEGGRDGVGPNLWGVVGATVASSETYMRYSPAMRDYGGDWTPERLDVYLAAPRTEVPGTIMTFQGLGDPVARAEVIAYLNQNGPSPIDFGGAAEPTASADAAAAEGAAEGEIAGDFGVLFVAPGVEETYFACTACHSERIVAQQGLTRERWDHLFEWMVEEQGMAELEEPERTIILDYLSEHYNTDRPHFPN